MYIFTSSANVKHAIIAWVIPLGLLLFFLFRVIQYQWVCDDAYIYFRYIDNAVVYGKGLVFNSGEFVEGFTSPLWLLWLSLLRILLPLFSLRQLVLLIGIVTAFLVFQVFHFCTSSIIKKEFSHQKVTNFYVPQILCIGTILFSEFLTSGLETPFVILYVVLFSFVVLLCPTKPYWIYGILMGIAPLIRPDLILFSLFLLFFIGSKEEIRKILSVKKVLTVISLFVGPTVLYEIFRIWYYAALLPNTYYVKAAEGASIVQGLRYLADILVYQPHIILIFLVVLFITLINKGFSTITFNRYFLLCCLFFYSGYVVLLGGDYMHGRFWLPSLLMLFISYTGLFEILVYKVFIKISSILSSIFYIVLFVILLPLWCSFQSLQTTLMNANIINNIADERNWSLNITYGNTISLWDEKDQNGLVLWGLSLHDIQHTSKNSLSVVTGNIGQVGYYSGPNVRLLDYDGLIDPFTARLTLETRGRPGHEKIAHPAHILQSNPTFWNTPFKEYNSLFLFPSDSPFPLVLVDVNPDLVNNLIPPENVQQLHQSLVSLAKINKDPNFSYLLLHVGKTSEDPEVIATVEENCKETSCYQSTWANWLNERVMHYAIVEKQIHNRHNVFDNLFIAIQSHFVAL